MGIMNEKINAFVEDWAHANGRPNVLTGYANACELVDRDLCSMPYGNAIVLAIPLNPNVVAQLGDGPTLEYYEEHNECMRLVSEIENALVDWLTAQGNRAITLAEARLLLEERKSEKERGDVKRVLSHRAVAACAGLGWVGKNALVITKRYGPAVKIAAVLTNAPTECSKEVFLSRCGRCTECISACPADAIRSVADTFNAAEFNAAEMSIAEMAYVDEAACLESCRQQSLAAFGVEADVCGRCIYACPYTQSYLWRSS